MRGFFVKITSLIRRNFEAIAALTPFNWFLDKSSSYFAMIENRNQLTDDIMLVGWLVGYSKANG